ncbi:hypothetical protein Slin15195_G127390 [Septoria linicola]|uniref:Uncharacterized protein n=1 Tax=Septoria linicola TaxID=215465 RepID=A0A9Q9B2F7_9PEZI|nr:hypothetical protein Slin14017_G083570 [Septoria linicola]USW59420.1 hypothetical protein Slin15195_G127390 [Septoria linicola]
MRLTTIVLTLAAALNAAAAPITHDNVPIIARDPEPGLGSFLKKIKNWSKEKSKSKVQPIHPGALRSLGLPVPPGVG